MLLRFVAFPGKNPISTPYKFSKSFINWKYHQREDVVIILLLSYTIPLDPRTKKNSHVISGCGPRCPVCKKYQRQFVRNGSTTTEFTLRAAHFLQPRPPQPLSGTVHIVYKLYMGTRRKVDDLNLYETLDDLLVKEKILTDDNINVIRSRDGSRVFYDKEHPRAEIYIYDYKEGDTCDEWNQNVHSGQVSGLE